MGTKGGLSLEKNSSFISSSSAYNDLFFKFMSKGIFKLNHSWQFSDNYKLTTATNLISHMRKISCSLFYISY